VIAAASIYARDVANSTPGLRVLIMRRWPRGVRKERVDVWLKDAGPSLELLHSYTHAGLTWHEFERRYRAEIIEDRPAILEQLRALEREYGRLTLLCREQIPPQVHCHREILCQLLAESPLQV
jgi:uncharacterized protein YeaO (DUF488 family)